MKEYLLSSVCVKSSTMHLFDIIYAVASFMNVKNKASMAKKNLQQFKLKKSFKTSLSYYGMLLSGVDYHDTEEALKLKDNALEHLLSRYSFDDIKFFYEYTSDIIEKEKLGYELTHHDLEKMRDAYDFYQVLNSTMSVLEYKLERLK